MLRRFASLLVLAMLAVACPVQQIAQVEIAPVDVAAPSPEPTVRPSPEPSPEASPTDEPSPEASPSEESSPEPTEEPSPVPTTPPPPPPSPDPGNRPPLASDVRVSTEEDKAILVDAAANDVDPDGDPLFVSLESPPKNGKLAVSGEVLSYTPNANYHGSDSFTYRVSDGKGGSDVGTVAITITPVNDRPDARDDSLSVSEDTSGQVNVLANDVDVDGDALTAKLVSGPSNGKVTQSGGTFTYTPNRDYIGGDSFTYEASDPSGATDRATVNISVGGVNDPPVAADDVLTLDEDTSKSVNVVANDRDPDGDSLTVSIVSGPGKGKASVSGGMISYTPNANANGSDELVYQVSDGNGGTDTATVRITINPINDPPIANGESGLVGQNCQNTVFNVLANDSDPDGDSLTVTQASAFSGTVSINKDGSLTYRGPSTGGVNDSITYTISDGNGGTDTASAGLYVNWCPTANNDSVSFNTFGAGPVPNQRDIFFNVITGSIQGGGSTGGADNDRDGQTSNLTYLGPANPSSGYAGVFVQCDQGGRCQVRATQGHSGSFNWTYTIQDANGGRSSATVTVTLFYLG